MDAYKLFDAAYITRGGPGTATELPGLLTYLVGFKDFDMVVLRRSPGSSHCSPSSSSNCSGTCCGNAAPESNGGWSWDGGWSGSSPYSL